MAGHARILQARPVAFLDQRVAVADATSLDFDSHPAGARLGDFTFNDFKRPVWSGDLRGTHLYHIQVLFCQKIPRLNLAHSGMLANGNSVWAEQKPACTPSHARGKIALVRAAVPLVASANNLDGLGSFLGRDAVHNILNEPPPADLHGRLKFTVEKFVDAADIAGKTVLDIGCGYGWFELWAAKQRVTKITGLDMTAADLKTASEHIPPGSEPRMFAEVNRVLRPDGCFYLSTPNDALRSILGDPTYWMIRHRHYRLSYFEALAREHGFKVARHAVKGGLIEIADMWNLYVSKWIFRRDRFFKQR